MKLFEELFFCFFVVESFFTTFVYTRRTPFHLLFSLVGAWRFFIWRIAFFLE